MAKKRSCRRTKNENELHIRAVKIRKMTDEQLINYIDSLQETEPEAVEEVPDKACNPVKDFIETIRENSIPGIGAATLFKLAKAAKEYGYLD